MSRTTMRAVIVLGLAFAAAVPAPAQESDGTAEVIALYKQAEEAKTAGKTKEAARLYENALAKANVVLGKDHLATASLINDLAVLYQSMGQHTKAEPLYQRSLQIKEARLGRDHLDLSDALNNLAGLYQRMGQPAKAEPLYKRCLAIGVAKLGKDHLDVASSLDNLAWQYWSMAQYAKAEPLFERSLEIREAKLGKDHPLVATSLNGLARLYERMAQYSKAESLFGRSLKIREAKLGKDHLDVALSLKNLAFLYERMAQYSKAEPLYQRSLEIYEVRLGKDHLVVAESIHYLAWLYQSMGRYAKAEPLYERSLEIAEAKLGKFHLTVAAYLDDMAVFYARMGRYAKAELLTIRSRDIFEAKLGKDHLDMALSLNNMSALYVSMGQYAKAEPLYKRSLEIREAKLGKDHPLVATSLDNLAGLYERMEQYEKAEPLFERSLEITEAKLGKEHPYTASSLNNLAGLYKAMGQYTKAEPLFERGLKIFEAKLDKDHPDMASSLNNLAATYKATGQYAKAEPLFERGLKIFEAKLDKDHPKVAQVLNNLAVLQGSQHRSARAASLFHRARQGTRRHVTSVLSVLTASEQLSFLKEKDRPTLDQALSLGLSSNDDAQRNALSAAWLANGKAQAAESLARSALLVHGSGDPRTAGLVAELLTARRALAGLALTTPRPGSEKEHARRHQQLADQENELARKLRLAGSAAVASDWVELTQVRRSLPAKGVLLDIVRMKVHDYQAKPGTDAGRPARYVAWVTPKAGQVRIVDLGEAKAVDDAVEKLRQALKEAPKLIEAKGEPQAEKALRVPLQKLSDLVLKPLLPHVGESEEWLVSPDANLWLVPWQMLLLADGKYAIEKHRISYLNSGRDLAARVPSKVTPTRALVLADPDFDLDGTPAKGEPDGTRSLSSLMKLGSVRRLPGTAAEAKAITPALRAYTKQAPRVLLGKDAVKSAFQEAKHPRVLVLSTHGFFLPDQQSKKDDKQVRLENPLLRCGLLLAGCNREGSRGVLTGLEVLGADLRGCELVVLSACETGLGDVQSGEGVAGLRQAFQMAGAEAVVSTLWQVPDRQSAQLMSLFFANLSKGQNKAEALRQAQLAVIEERRDDSAAAHPFFWAAFTLTGR